MDRDSAKPLDVPALARACDATFEGIQAAGAEVMQEPMDQPFGVRACAFRDPFGNHLRFAEPSSE